MGRSLTKEEVFKVIDLYWPEGEVITSIEISSSEFFKGFTLEYFTQRGLRRKINQSWEILLNDIESNNTSTEQC